jgi:GNAT superfamily N-acetyltransferase
MPMEVLIRRAVLTDLKTVQNLNHDLFISDYPSDNDLNVEWPFEKDGEDYFRSMISGEAGVCFVAEKGNKIVGYLAGCIKKDNSYSFSKLAELENMLVREGERSQGIGSKLIEVFLQWCKENKAKRVIVKAYSPNIRAIEFYKRSGFKPFVTELIHEIDKE